MKMTVTETMFCDEMMSFRPENFTYEGLSSLYDYLIDYEESTGEEIELDPVSICCDFSEYEDLDAIKREYNSIETIEDLYDRTLVIEFGNGIIIQNF